MKNTFFCILSISFQILLSSMGLAQSDKLRYEVGIKNDNDVYLWIKSDRYYTNGLSVDFLMSLNRKEESASSLEFNFQHRMYTGVAIVREDKEYLDRPFAAILALQSTYRHTFNSKRQLVLSLNLEQVGPKASGKSVQSFIHTLFNLYDVKGWHDQVPNSFGVDLGINYLEDLYTSSNQLFSVGTMLDAVVGINNTWFQASIPLKLGKTREMNRSVYSKGHVNSFLPNDEFFVYFKPGFMYQLKNSSLQNWNKIAHQYPNNALENYIFTQDFGVVYSKGKTSLSFSILRHSTEMKAMKYNHHQYGRLQLSRRF